MRVLLISSLLLGSLSFAHAQGDTVKVKIDENSPELFYNKGLDLLKAKNYGEAVNEFTKAIGMKADFEKAFYNRGLSYSEMNKAADALNDFNKSIELNPNADYSYFSRGESMYN